MEKLPQVQAAVGSALLTLGDGNWKMGEGVQVGKVTTKSGESDETVLLEHFVCEQKFQITLNITDYPIL